MASVTNETDSWILRRRRMVEDQIRARGIRDERVLDAMRTVPRERFCPATVQEMACDDRALPVGHDQTISQPFIVAYMTEHLALTPDCRVLEVGTGTGYQSAVLANLCHEVITIERIETLRKAADQRLRALGFSNVTVVEGDGSIGYAARAPYDRIVVTAAAPAVPQALVDQLAEGGRLVIPVGGTTEQMIVSVERKLHRTVETPLLACRFVKLFGREGW